MAEKIGFISFSAFELTRANEFSSIKQRLYDSKKGARSFFEIHPSLPPFKQLARLGVNPMIRKTPAELIPLMNEYHRYFLEKAEIHESYLRWWRRHRAWDRETEVTFGRFTELRDHLNEQFAHQDYMRRGRLQQIVDHAAAKSWMNTDMMNVVSENEGLKQKSLSAKALQKKMQQQALYHASAFAMPDERQVFEHRHEVSKLSSTTHEDLRPMNLHREPRWMHALAIADYQMQMQQKPIAPATLATNTAEGMQTPLAAPIVKKVSGLG